MDCVMLILTNRDINLASKLFRSTIEIGRDER